MEASDEACILEIKVVFSHYETVNINGYNGRVWLYLELCKCQGIFGMDI